MKFKLLLLICFSFISLEANSTFAKKIDDKTIHFSDGTIKKGGHRNWRNNNPGNIEYGVFAKENGAIGTDGRFAIFSTMRDGFIAQVNLLSGSKYGNKSIAQAIHRYAPSFENNTGKYISFLTNNLNISRDRKINDLPYNKRIDMVRLMAQYEGMKPGVHYNTGTKLVYNENYNTRTRVAYNGNNSNDSVINYSSQRRTQQHFNTMLNPKKTQLHKILLGA